MVVENEGGFVTVIRFPDVETFAGNDSGAADTAANESNTKSIAEMQINNNFFNNNTFF